MERAKLLLGVGALAASLLAACASAPTPWPVPASRIADSAPERIAAQRAATPGLKLERDDERWGFEAARERRRATEQKRSQHAAAQAPIQNGPVDLRQAPEDVQAPAKP